MRKFLVENDIMGDKRRVKRLEEENKITMTIVSGGGSHPDGRLISSQSKDISVLGAKIQADFLLPVDTLLEMDIKLKDLSHKITAFGKVKWSKIIDDDKSYEAGLEFVNARAEVTPTLVHYMSSKLKSQNAKDNYR